MTTEITRAQRLRLRRTAFAAGGALALSAVMLLLDARGDLRITAFTLGALLAVFWTVNLGIFAVIASGANLRFSDPSLTFAQILWATVATFTASYVIEDGRHLVLMIYLLAMMFGAFRLRIGQYLIVTVSAVVLYAAVIVLLDQRHPGELDLHAEVVDWLVFFAVMVGFSLLGAEAGRLRGELQQRNRELERARDAAASASASKSHFLARTSHELRTPLNVILGAKELVDASRLSAEERTALTRAHDAAERLLSVVNGMIDLSQLESDALELRPAPLELRRELETIGAMMSPSAGSHAPRFELVLDPALPQRVHVDGARLREVLVHLVANAFKYTRAGHVRLEARCEPDARVRFSVEDSGEGIAEERIATVFSPFARGDDATHAHDGSGLGLALCHQLVRRMGGELAVESRRGDGARFSFSLPLPALADGIDGDPAPASLRVLVVDDSEDNRMLLRAFLQSSVARIDEAADGEAALEQLARRRYDVVLMDMHMPGMDGLDTTRAIRERERAEDAQPTVILALTADDTVSDRERSLAAGCDEHLVKPIAKKALLERLAGYAGRRSAADVERSAPRGGADGGAG